MRFPWTETDMVFQFQDLYARWRGNRYMARIGLQQILGFIIISQLRVSFETDDRVIQNLIGRLSVLFSFLFNLDAKIVFIFLVVG